MTLGRICSCGHQLSTKNVTRTGRMVRINTTLLLAMCKKCGSTVTVAKRVKNA